MIKWVQETRKHSKMRLNEEYEEPAVSEQATPFKKESCHKAPQKSPSNAAMFQNAHHHDEESDYISSLSEPSSSSSSPDEGKKDSSSSSNSSDDSDRKRKEVLSPSSDSSNISDHSSRSGSVSNQSPSVLIFPKPISSLKPQISPNDDSPMKKTHSIKKAKNRSNKRPANSAGISVVNMLKEKLKKEKKERVKKENSKQQGKIKKERGTKSIKMSKFKEDLTIKKSSALKKDRTIKFIIKRDDMMGSSSSPLPNHSPESVSNES